MAQTCSQGPGMLLLPGCLRFLALRCQLRLHQVMPDQGAHVAHEQLRRDARSLKRIAVQVQLQQAHGIVGIHPGGRTIVCVHNRGMHNGTCTWLEVDVRWGRGAWWAGTHGRGVCVATEHARCSGTHKEGGGDMFGGWMQVWPGDFHASA